MSETVIYIMIVAVFAIIACMISIAICVYRVSESQKNFEVYVHEAFSNFENRQRLFDNDLDEHQDHLDYMMQTYAKMKNVIEEYSEASHLAKDGEKLYNEGLSNILNYSMPVMNKKGDDVK